MTPDLWEFVQLGSLGLIVGAYGTLVGAGGGSILVPFLLILLPQESPGSVAAISLAVVFFNAYSGTIAYMRVGRVDYRAGTIFTIAGLPGAVLGTLLVHELSRNLFDPIFGVMLTAIGVFLISNPMGPSSDVAPEVESEVVEKRLLIGSIGSAYIGVLSSLLGIGGGIIHVPFLIRLLRMPPHVATATSHFVLTFIALIATVTHVVLGEFGTGIAQTAYLSVGVMMGAPLGAAFSLRLQGTMIVRLLALALCLVGVRLLLRGVF